MTSSTITKSPDNTALITCSFLSDEDLGIATLTSKSAREIFVEAASVERADQIKSLATAILSVPSAILKSDRAYLEHFTKVSYSSEDASPTLLRALRDYHSDRSLILKRLSVMSLEQLTIINEKLLKEKLPPYLKHIAELAICMKKKKFANFLQRPPLNNPYSLVTKIIGDLAVCFVKCRQFTRALCTINQLPTNKNLLLFRVYDEAIQRGYFNEAESIVDSSSFKLSIEKDWAYGALCLRLIPQGRVAQARRACCKINTESTRKCLEELLSREAS